MVTSFLRFYYVCIAVAIFFSRSSCGMEEDHGAGVGKPRQSISWGAVRYSEAMQQYLAEQAEELKYQEEEAQWNLEVQQRKTWCLDEIRKEKPREQIKQLHAALAQSNNDIVDLATAHDVYKRQYKERVKRLESFIREASQSIPGRTSKMVRLVKRKLGVQENDPAQLDRLAQITRLKIRIHKERAAYVEMQVRYKAEILKIYALQDCYKRNVRELEIAHLKKSKGRYVE